jgi:signal transduction histidine kinase
VQLLVILLDNALDHSPADGTVTVSVMRAGRSVELAVLDEGPGVPLDERERIFAPFHRLPAPRGTRAGGSGLGLAIGRRIAAAHDGTIVAGDGVHGGARFTVRLPAAGRPGF